jgi:hypothetical protein
MMRGASGDECGNLLGQEYNRPAREAGVLKKAREATLTLNLCFRERKIISESELYWLRSNYIDYI